jgi:hypothetical protein
MRNFRGTCCSRRVRPRIYGEEREMRYFARRSLPALMSLMRSRFSDP